VPTELIELSVNGCFWVGRKERKMKKERTIAMRKRRRGRVEGRDGGRDKMRKGEEGWKRRGRKGKRAKEGQVE